MHLRRNLRHIWSVRTVFVAASLVTALVPACRGERLVPPPDEGVVTYVLDGDTIEVRIADRLERVRLLGIDTPETVDRDQPVECYGPEASAELKELLPVGTVVRLERDVEPRDAYNRLLAYVYRVGDSLFVNAEMARRGLAVELQIAPNGARQPVIRAAVDEARAANRAIWGVCPRPGS